MTSAFRPTQHHKPIKFNNHFFESRTGGEDPAQLNEAAYLSAHTILHRGRTNTDPKITERLVRFTDEYGLETIASMWAQAPAISLPGALWRIYALRDTLTKNGAPLAHYYELGMESDWASRVVSGLADPPTETEVVRTVNEILSGAFTGEFDIALERFAAFCRVVAAGQDAVAHSVRPGLLSTPQDGASQPTPSPEVRAEAARRASTLHTSARKLRGTAIELETSAAKWRAGTLN